MRIIKPILALIGTISLFLGLVSADADNILVGVLLMTVFISFGAVCIWLAGGFVGQRESAHRGGNRR